MKNYEAPEFIVNKLVVSDVIAASFTESSDDNETGWIESWTSGVLGGK